MKKLVLYAIASLLCCIIFAQEERADADTKGKFRLENLYAGGGLNLGAGNNSFAIGILPEIGYSVTRWLDAGLSFNLNYQSQKIFNADGSTFAKYHALTYGTGAFVRIWPVSFVHITVQPEYNWIKPTIIEVYNNQRTTTLYKAESVLVGIGYGSRNIGKQLSYITLMIDVAHNINSPYRDQYNHAQPLIRTGVGFYLRKK